EVLNQGDTVALVLHQDRTAVLLVNVTDRLPELRVGEALVDAGQHVDQAAESAPDGDGGIVVGNAVLVGGVDHDDLSFEALMPQQRGVVPAPPLALEETARAGRGRLLELAGRAV